MFFRPPPWPVKSWEWFSWTAFQEFVVMERVKCAGIVPGCRRQASTLRLRTPNGCARAPPPLRQARRPRPLRLRTPNGCARAICCRIPAPSTGPPRTSDAGASISSGVAGRHRTPAHQDAAESDFGDVFACVQDPRAPGCGGFGRWGCRGRATGPPRTRMRPTGQMPADTVVERRVTEINAAHGSDASRPAPPRISAPWISAYLHRKHGFAILPIRTLQLSRIFAEIS